MLPTEDLSEAGLICAAARRAVGHEPRRGAAGCHTVRPRQPEGALYQHGELPWSEVSAGKNSKLLETVDGLARSADSNASPTFTISWSDSDERILIARLTDRLVMDQRPMTRLSAQVTMTRDGVSHSGFANIAAREELSWYTEDRIAGNG